MSDTATQTDNSWFGKAARSSILNALWLGPANIYFWFKSGRFEHPDYAFMAQAEDLSIDEVIAFVLVVEMFLMLFSLFVVYSIMAAAKAKMNIYTSIIFLVCGTLLWSVLGIAIGI